MAQLSDDHFGAYALRKPSDCEPYGTRTRLPALRLPRRLRVVRHPERTPKIRASAPIARVPVPDSPPLSIKVAPNLSGAITLLGCTTITHEG